MANGNNNHNDWVEAQILEVLNERPGKRMNYKQISSRLGFNSKTDRELTGEALMDLVNKKLIVEQPKGSFYIEEVSEFLEGKIEFNKWTERSAEAKLINAEADVKTAEKYAQAATIYKENPITLRLREFQLWTTVSQNNNTQFFVIPSNLLDFPKNQEKLDK